MNQNFLTTAALSLALLGAAVTAHAASTRVRGTATNATASTLELTTRAGAAESFALTPDTRYIAESTGSLADIKPGSYIGSAAVPAAGGKLRALEVSVFPPAMKGMGEGHYPWDLGKSSSMTNGTVGSLVVSHGNEMKVSYKGGEKTILVPADVPIVTMAPGSAADIKAGVKIIVSPSMTDPKTAAAVIFGVDGIMPPQ